MLLLLFSWIFIAWMCLAIGAASWKLIALATKNKAFQILQTDYILLSGFLIISLLISYISIFHSINYTVAFTFVILAIACTILCFSTIKTLLQAFVQGWKSTHIISKLLIFSCFITTLIIGTGKIIHYDTLYYHLQTIQWIEHYPVIPGLGNIHTRLAYNSHFFLPSALFSISLSGNYTLYPLNSFFFFIFSTRILLDINKNIQQNNVFNFILKLSILLLFIYHCTPFINSTSTDAITSVLIFYVFFLFIEWRQDPAENKSKLLLLWLTAFAVVTFKLSSLLLLLFLPFTLTFKRSIIKRVAAIAVLGSIILLPFFIRNYYLSGYLIFPHPAIDVFNVDWKVPKNEALTDEQFIEVWAKLPNGQRSELMNYQDETIVNRANIHSSNWLLPWFSTLGIKWKLIYMINLFIIPILFIALYKKDYTIAILSFVLILNLAFWLFKSPNPRFAYGILFMTFSLNMAYFIAVFLKRRVLRLSLQLALLTTVAGVIYLCKENIITPRAQGWAMLLLPEKLDTIATKDFNAQNFTLHTPSNDRRCYNTSIPCTPYPKRDLVQRGKNLAEGFRRLSDTPKQHEIIIGSLKIK